MGRSNLPPVRRVVTGHDKNGKAVFLMDGKARRIELYGIKPVKILRFQAQFHFKVFLKHLSVPHPKIRE